MHIDSYSFGSMTVDGKTYSSDLIGFPDRIISDWWRAEGHSLAVEDIEEILDYHPDVLVVGKGDIGLMSVSRETAEELEKQGITLIQDRTGRAVRLFNEEIKKGRRVIGAFHLTC